jgi:hypothetical protein
VSCNTSLSKSSSLWAMVVSAVQEAKRAFVKKLLACAVACGVAVQVNRDASDPEVRAAYAQVQCQLGRVQARELRKAKVAWEKALAPKAPVGRPSAPLSQQLFRVQAALVMLTYHGIQSLQHWSVFLAFVQKNLLTWTAKHWCATLEACESGNWHVHLVLQFHTPEPAGAGRSRPGRISSSSSSISSNQAQREIVVNFSVACFAVIGKLEICCV